MQIQRWIWLTTFHIFVKLRSMSTVITDDDARKYVAENVKQLLADRKMNQSDLARATGDTFMAISRVVRAQHVAGYGVVCRIAEALGVKADDLSKPPKKTSRKASA